MASCVYIVSIPPKLVDTDGDHTNVFVFVVRLSTVADGPLC